MSNYKYSAKNDVFIPASFIAEYEKAGWDLSDVIEVEDDVYNEYSNPPAGKRRVAGKDGLPAWDDIPPPTKAELTGQAERKKQTLITEASQKTQLWQTQLMLGIITEEDKASLKEWMLYVQEVQVVDPSLGADVVWPTPPASPAR
ncbi:tail fiber assembly protein [Morganella morganii]|nr:tail fiber assembly protein [Morganella morganii]